MTPPTPPAVPVDAPASETDPGWTPYALAAFLAVLVLWLLVHVVQVARGDALVVDAKADAVAGAPAASAGAASAVAPPGGAASAAPAPPPDARAQRLATVRLLVLFMLTGALGAALHGLGSLVVYVGNRQFKASWSLWYVTLPLRGALLALGFYCLLQGGLLGGIGAGSGGVGELAMMGATFLVGLFSDLALEKLRDVFNLIFLQSQKTRRDPIVALRKPRVTGVAIEGTPPALVVRGEGFDASDRLELDGVPVTVGQRSATRLSTPPPAGAAAGSVIEVAVVPLDRDKAEPSERSRYTVR